MKNSRASRGGGFRGIIEYCADHDNAKIVGGNMSGQNPRELAREFSASRCLQPDCETPVWTMALSLPEGEHLDPETWKSITDDFMRMMLSAGNGKKKGGSRKVISPENHQHVVYLHEKEKQEHVHLIVCRIGLDGMIWHATDANILATKIVSELEKKYGLQITKTAELDDRTGLPSTHTQKKKLKKGEIEKALRTGFNPPRLIIQQAVDSVLLAATTIQEFSAALEKLGVIYSEKEDASGKTIGVTFQLGDLKFGVSKLGDAYRHAAILLKLEQNQNGKPDKNATSSPTPIRPRPSASDRVVGKVQGRADRRSSQDTSPVVGSGGYPPSPAQEKRLVRLTARARIISGSVAPLIPSRKGYKDWVGRDGRVWFYDRETGQSAGLAFRQIGHEKILEIHRPVDNLSDHDAEALVCLAVESGITGPLIIEGDPDFISKITQAARRLKVPVRGDPVPAATVLPDPSDHGQATPGVCRRMK